MFRLLPTQVCMMRRIRKKGREWLPKASQDGSCHPAEDHWHQEPVKLGRAEESLPALLKVFQASVCTVLQIPSVNKWVGMWVRKEDLCQGTERCVILPSKLETSGNALCTLGKGNGRSGRLCSGIAFSSVSWLPSHTWIVLHLDSGRSSYRWWLG